MSKQVKIKAAVGLIFTAFMGTTLSCATFIKSSKNAEPSQKIEAVTAVTAKEIAPPPPPKADEKGGEGKPYTIQLKENEKVEAVVPPKENLFSLHFKEITLDSIIGLLGDRGKNFRYVIHPDVGERKVLGLALENVTWREALHIIAKLHNLDITEEHGLIIVNTGENATRFQIDLQKRTEVAMKISEAERIKMLEDAKTKDAVDVERSTYRTFKLKYAEPNEVVTYLNAVINGMGTAVQNGTPAAEGASAGSSQTSGQNAGEAQGAAGGASSSNQNGGAGQLQNQQSAGSKVLFGVFTKASIITAYGSPSQLDEIGKRLGEIDVPQRQIYIEARIVEVFRNYSRELGIEWGGNTVGGNMPALSTNTAIIAGSSAGGGVGNAAVSLPAVDPGGTPVGALNLALSDIAGTTKLNLRISALESEGKSKTISNPKITTINGVKAEIKSGREIPYQQSAGGAGGATTVAFKNAVISLSVTPFVTPDNMINLQTTAQKDDADFTNLVLGTPSILTRTVDTNVLVMDGGTAVLGGVFENQKQDTEKAVPFLSRIPILGWFFKGSAKVDNEKELLIFITPRIVKGNFS